MKDNPNGDWRKKIDKFDLEKSIGWELAIVKRVDKFETVVETINNKLINIYNTLVNLSRNKNL